MLLRPTVLTGTFHDTKEYLSLVILLFLFIFRDKDTLQCHQTKYGTKYIMNLKNLAESKHAKISQALTILLVILVLILLTLLGAYAYLKKGSMRGRFSPLLEAVSRKVHYNKIESQDV